MHAASMSKIDEQTAYEAAQKVVQVHCRLADFLRMGMKLPEIDRFVARTLDGLGCESCFFGYRPSRSGKPRFPSYSCLSVNDCIVHGTAGYYDQPMKPGDVLKIDIGVRFRGWIGDAGWTYVFGEMTPLVRRLTDAGKESLRRGVLELRPGNRFINWAKAVQNHAEAECGFHLVRGLGGHGLFDKRAGQPSLHAAPFISNVVQSYGEWAEAQWPCEPGELLAVEPMIAVGTGDIRERGWPIFTADGSLAVHYEHDVLITANGPRVLTEGLESVTDVITR
ncbi:MAG: methionine aminopeptidase [Phycisphaerae bacterium]